MKYHEIAAYESHGTHGGFAVRVEAATNNEIDWNDKRIRNAAYEATDRVKEAVMEVAIESDPQAQERAKAERAELLGLFPEPVHVEEIPNGYCSLACCKHLPWFVVTTPKGRIKIGNRKRVIMIDWSESDLEKSAEDMFGGEAVTKGERYIHAWGLEKAQEYVSKLLA